MTTFPDAFLWGSSTAGHQVEGGNVNADLWPLEWAEGSQFVEPSLDACDHYHRYGEDIATLAELGLNAYRFSVEWSRIEPEPGAFSRAALDHYRRMVGTCLEHGVTPVVTYCHFTTPRWFAGAGGWAAADAPDRFGRYAERVTEHLGDLLPWVATLNEPNVLDLMQQTGAIPMGVGERAAGCEEPEAPAPAGVGGFDPARYRMGLVGAGIEQMAAIHRRAVEAIKSGPGDAKVGLDPGPGRPPARRGRRGALGAGPAGGEPRLAGGVPGRRLRRRPDLHPGADRPRGQGRLARGGPHHADRVGGLPGGPRAHRADGRRARPGPRRW